MLCQLSYRGLTTTRLCTLAASSAKVVFRSHLLHSLINSGTYAVCLPAQSSGQRAVPRDRAGPAKITASADGYAALSDQRNELFDCDRCQDALPEDPGESSRLVELQRAEGRWFAGRRMKHPAQPMQFGIPAAVLDLMPADVLPVLLISV
jgi:hypothetical protein